MTPEEYAAKRQAKIDRLRERAEAKEAQSSALYNQSDRMASCIPMGQPILIGHHSERRDRNFRERMHNKMRKAGELQDEAERLRRRAEAAEANTAIFSDAPNAVESLAAKIERLEKRQEAMRFVNKHVRANNKEALAEMGYTDEQITKFFTPDFCGRVGFPSYALTNNSAVIRDAKKRMARLEAQRNDETQEFVIGAIRIVDNVEDNRIQVFFPGKPAEEIRSKLKHNGFRWSPYNGCWQSYRKQWSMDCAKEIATALNVA